MNQNNQSPEFAALPPEYVQNPEQEFSSRRMAPEFQPLPPEFAQRTSPEPETEPKKRRSLRSMLAVPTVLLLSAVGLWTWNPAQPQKDPDVPPPVTEPAETEPPETLPVETAEPIPDLPQGSVILDVDYAVRDGELVRYKYVVYTPEPSLDATQEQIDAYDGPIWPVSVYAQVSDGANNAVHPETDPDVWEEFRYTNEEYVINAAGLEGDLTLTLRAVYTERGEERQTVEILPLAQLPPTPETWAELKALGGDQVEFTAYLKPQSGDGSDFDLETWYMGQIGYFEDETMGFSLVNDPRSIPVEYDPENGFTVRYTGGSAIQSIPEGGTLSVNVGLRDRNTGYVYSIESNRIDPMSAPRLSAELALLKGGYADFTARFTVPEGDDHAYDLTVDEVVLECVDPGVDTYRVPMGPEPLDVELTADETGYTIRYLGPSSYVSLEGNLLCYGVLKLTDSSTGQTYEVESDGVWLTDAGSDLPEFPMEGKVVVTVYNDTLTFDVPSTVDTGGWLTVLYVEAFPVEDFTELELPEPVAPSGYEFLGWVVHVNNPFDYGSEEDLFEIYEGDPPVDILTTPDRYAFPVESTLTREDVSHVPPYEEGIRYVNVHAVWVKKPVTDPLLFFNDGMGNLTGYNMDVPLASEGYIYLCRYPVPEREGWTFTGWYDNDGNKVDLLVCYFSFTPMNYNEDGDFLGYDWSTTQTVYLNAGWTMVMEDWP